MKAECLRYYDLIETNRKALKEYLEGFSTEELQTIPADGKWSAMMTVHHVMLAEQGGLAYCLKKLSFNPELDEATEDQISLESKVPYMLRSPKYKAVAPPMIAGPNLDNTLTVNVAFSKWDELRSSMKSFLDDQPDARFSKALYKHPIAGKMRLQGMMMFFDGHQDSHTNQIKGNFEMMANLAGG